MEHTLLLIKPDAVHRGLVGKILARFETMEFQIAHLGVLKGSKELWTQFYPSDSSWLENVGKKTISSFPEMQVFLDSKESKDVYEVGKKIKSWLVDYMSSSEVVAVVWKGNEVVRKIRKACGHTLPLEADVGTIRFDYSSDSPQKANEARRPICNIVHASDPNEFRDGKPSSVYEVELLFPNYKFEY